VILVHKRCMSLCVLGENFCPVYPVLRLTNQRQSLTGDPPVMNRVIRLALLILAVGIIIPRLASASGGSCAAFASGACPASIPSGVTSFYFIDYAGGSDSNAGTSESSPWQHMPTCANATSTAASHTPGSGEGWILKGGVTVDYHCWPANLPWGGASGAPDYMGPDPGWYTGSSWTRPIFNGGGSSVYNSNSSALMNDNAHSASHLVLDNIEFTGLYFSGTNCANSNNACAYVAVNMGLGVGSSTEVGWEFKNLYAHNVTHTAYPTSNDPGNEGALFWMPRDAGSSFHDGYIDNSDGGADCCRGVYTGNIYRNYFSGLANVVFNPSSPNNDETIFLFHDNTMRNIATTFYPDNGSEPHGNCIHVFGNMPSSFNELIYNNRIDCTNLNAENLEVEEDSATVYYFNNVNTNMYQPNGYDTSSFSGAGQGGTYYYFQNTEECGVDPSAGYICVGLRNAPTVFDYNNFGVSSNSSGGPAVLNHSGWSGSFTSIPNNSKTCGGIATTNFGGTLICAPIGSGNGTGNLNFTETYPFAPLDSTAAATIGTASNLISLCSTISGINAAAGSACLSDTTLGVTYNTADHTVSWPARTPVARPTSGAWQIGAYQFANGVAPQAPTGLAAVVQ